MRGQVLAEFFHHRRFIIRPVADVHLGNGLAFEGDDVGADAIAMIASYYLSSCQWIV